MWFSAESNCLIFLLGVNILKEFDALPLLKTSVDNGAVKLCFGLMTYSLMFLWMI